MHVIPSPQAALGQRMALILSKKETRAQQLDIGLLLILFQDPIEFLLDTTLCTFHE